MRFGFIRAERANYPVSVLCRVMQVTRGGFYAWSKRGRSARVQRDDRLRPRIRIIHSESKKRYGSPRVHEALIKQGERVSRKRIARLMREEGLRGRRPRCWVQTTDSSGTKYPAPNLLKRNFQTAAPNRVWAADITYIPTREGWCYLSVILDLYSRRVVGWAIADHLRTELVLKALEMAVERRETTPGLIHHSDRGSQYASEAFERRLNELGFVPSMSRKGDCWDNAVVESFFATLKVECADRPYRSRQDARHSLFQYIEIFYNRRRLHSYLGYNSPAEYEETTLAV